MVERDISRERVCPVCGRRFWMADPKRWAYRRSTRCFCTWHCLRAYDRQTEVAAKLRAVPGLGTCLARAGVSQSELARRIGEAPNNIGHCVLDGRKMNIGRIRKAAEYLGCDVRELTGGGE